MMKKVLKILKWCSLIFLIPILYIFIALLLSYIPINPKINQSEKNKSIYIKTNGVHLDIIIDKNDMDSLLLDGLKYDEHNQYFSFSWGEKIFYLNTPTWGDLTFKNGFRALFLKNSTLVHLTRYTKIRKDWVAIKVNQTQLANINHYLNNTFYVNSNQQKVLLPNKGYDYNDDFYEANGQYSLFNTCNTWVNTGLKQSGIKSCLWTPFDFSLMYLHQQ